MRDRREISGIAAVIMMEPSSAGVAPAREVPDHRANARQISVRRRMERDMGEGSRILPPLAGESATPTRGRRLISIFPRALMTTQITLLYRMFAETRLVSGGEVGGGQNV